MYADAATVTSAVLTEKLPVVATDGGSVAAVLVFASVTTAPVAGAVPVRTTLPAAVPHPPIMVVGGR